jgi:tRNA wybutosine-synthesizing protein 3
MVNAFEQKKQKILSSLNVPSNSYTDLSPKGSVDARIRDLIDEINAVSGLVTTSSCAGRVSIFLEGKKRTTAKASQVADGEKSKEFGPTGKGGGRWLFVSHDPVDVSEVINGEGTGLLSRLGLERSSGEVIPNGASLVHFKFEPMVCNQR